MLRRSFSNIKMASEIRCGLAAKKQNKIKYLPENEEFFVE
jgi:hypothetical protein